MLILSLGKMSKHSSEQLSVWEGGIKYIQAHIIINKWWRSYRFIGIVVTYMNFFLIDLSQVKLYVLGSVLQGITHEYYYTTLRPQTRNVMFQNTQSIHIITNPTLNSHLPSRWLLESCTVCWTHHFNTDTWRISQLYPWWSWFDELDAVIVCCIRIA